MPSNGSRSLMTRVASIQKCYRALRPLPHQKVPSAILIHLPASAINDSATMARAPPGRSRRKVVTTR